MLHSNGSIEKLYYSHVQLNLLHVDLRINIGLLQFRGITPFQDDDHLFDDVTSNSNLPYIILDKYTSYLIVKGTDYSINTRGFGSRKTIL